MFLQSYMYQAAVVLTAAYNDRARLHTSDERSTSIDPVAIHYGNLEFRARARRYLHFAMPCMAHDLWARGLKKDTPTLSMVEKKTSDLAKALNKALYRNRSVVRTPEEAEDIIQSNFIDTDLTLDQTSVLKSLLWQPHVGISSLRNIPFYDDGHGFNFFYDNTPLDASRNLLYSQAHAAVEADPSRAVGLPRVGEIFGHDEHFVLSQFRDTPNGCLGPSNDPSIFKKLQLLMGPEFVMDVGMASIRDLREWGLWHPTEFELLMMSDGMSISSALKSAFGIGISAPIALYWSWIEKAHAPDAPTNTKQWIRKELSDTIEPGGIYHVTLDACTLDWLFSNGIAKADTNTSDEVFKFPNYDRDRYATRKQEDRNMSFQDWAWSDANAIIKNRSLGVKIIGLDHPKYIPSADASSLSEEEKETQRRREEVSAASTGYINRYGRSRDLDGSRKSVLSNKAKEFLEWARATVSEMEDIADGSVEDAEYEPLVTKSHPGVRPTQAAGSVGTMSLDMSGTKEAEPSDQPAKPEADNRDKDANVSRMNLS